MTPIVLIFGEASNSEIEELIETGFRVAMFSNCETSVRNEFPAACSDWRVIPLSFRENTDLAYFFRHHAGPVVRPFPANLRKIHAASCYVGNFERVIIGTMIDHETLVELTLSREFHTIRSLVFKEFSDLVRDTLLVARFRKITTYNGPKDFLNKIEPGFCDNKFRSKSIELYSEQRLRVHAQR